MKILIIISFCLFLVFQPTIAQQRHFITSGTVEFEKTINVYALVKKQINKQNENYMQSAYEQYKNTKPQFMKLKSVLTFTSENTLFKAADENSIGSVLPNLVPFIEQPNIVFTDLHNSTSIIQKRVYEKIFLLKDSIRKITWKITDETREIAGYNCRRANALIMDSIYVVAFYTDLIPVSAGPESFAGLPGMILGIALPHENISWFATQVTESPIPTHTLKPMIKGVPVNRKELETILEKKRMEFGNDTRFSLNPYLW